MHLPPPSRVSPLLVSLLFILAACNSSPLVTPPAEPSPTTHLAAPAGTPAGSPTSASTAAPVENLTVVTPTDGITPTNPAHATCPPTREEDIDPAAILELGPGPGIPPTTATGDKLVIVGSVYAADCTPLAGATLNVWQTDANGEYGPGHGSDDMRCCYLMGSLSTDSNGHYQLITVKPAHYKGEQPPPPAHIHLEISHPQAGQWQTEIVFTGDPYLPQTLQGYILVTLESAPASAEAAAFLRGVADIILNRSGN